MEREQVIKLAREAGMPMSWLDDKHMDEWPELEKFAALLAGAQEAQPDPIVMQYLTLTDAMHYEAGPQLLSAEEYAAALYEDATRYRWLRDQAGSVFSTTPDGWRMAVVAHAPGHGIIPRGDDRELDSAIDAAMCAHSTKATGAAS